MITEEFGLQGGEALVLQFKQRVAMTSPNHNY